LLLGKIHKGDVLVIDEQDGDLVVRVKDKAVSHKK
jgi:hypothetical protein